MTPTAPGRYFHTDDKPDSRPRPIIVDVVNGELHAMIRNADGDGFDIVKVREMAGSWELSSALPGSA